MASEFAGFRFPPEIIVLSVRWYLRVALSYRDVEELLDELLPEACHVDAARENNRIEADHGRLKARRRPMRGLTRLRSGQTVSAGHALVQNIRRGHHELGSDTRPQLRLAATTDGGGGRGPGRRWVGGRHD
ncbi:DDE domain-containing protein [Parafrankia irregularis]|uniref:DDE domain-containing protein n=1 Tax=Parafrankia irregularis TaxID=795642 RepID=A0A0S4QJC2_9ACTN|nr:MULTISPECIES: DDE-type integrase/transposase/recombinase [Parafrankia]MBE3205726.1 DDE-type integrase/transposase/recombinase [Parafrankia sp. CH37]CUU55374.1 DDE domain-containing protein [Parafrankia irregularis]